MRQNGDTYAAEHLRQGSPTNATFAESCNRLLVGGDLAIAATGVELAVAIPLQAGEVITNITFVVGGTAAVTPTAGYVVLRDPTGAKLAQSADLGSTARAANTAYTIPLTAAYTAVTPGLYYIGISFTAGTVPTLRGVSVSHGVVAGALGVSAGVLCKSHGTAVGAVAPATIATPTTTFGVVYLIAT